MRDELRKILGGLVDRLDDHHVAALAAEVADTRAALQDCAEHLRKSYDAADPPCEELTRAEAVAAGLNAGSFAAFIEHAEEHLRNGYTLGDAAALGLAVFIYAAVIRELAEAS